MTPYEMDVMLWYFTRVVDHPDIERNPPVWRPTIDQFLEDRLLVRADSEGRCYRIGDRGIAYVEGLRSVPLPRRIWVIDWSSCQPSPHLDPDAPDSDP